MRADDTADLVLMRAAEMYLIEAEAKVRDGVALAQAVAPLNTLRNARGVGDYEVTGKSQEDVINEILMERRRELWGEGFGITDDFVHKKLWSVQPCRKMTKNGSRLLAGRW